MKKGAIFWLAHQRVGPAQAVLRAAISPKLL
jgi:hypothetical protein